MQISLRQLLVFGIVLSLLLGAVVNTPRYLRLCFQFAMLQGENRRLEAEVQRHHGMVVLSKKALNSSQSVREAAATFFTPGPEPWGE
jgi:hypothetical protein